MGSRWMWRSAAAVAGAVLGLGMCAGGAFASSVFFCNSGAEANEGAFKIARKWGRAIAPGKTGIVSLRGAFHGRLFATLAATDRTAYQAPFTPLAPGVSIHERDLTDLDDAVHLVGAVDRNGQSAAEDE